MLPLLGFRVNSPHRASGLFLFSFWGLSSGSQHQEMFARHHHTPRNTRAKFSDVLVACRNPRHSKKKEKGGGGTSDRQGCPQLSMAPPSPLNGWGHRDGVFPFPRCRRHAECLLWAGGAHSQHAQSKGENDFVLQHASVSAGFLLLCFWGVGLQPRTSASSSLT